MQPPPRNAAPILLVPTLLRLPTVMSVTGLGRSTIYRMIAKDQFPRPVRVGDRAVAWRQADLETWSHALPSTQ